MPPLVSVIIPTYNSGAMVCEAIESVLDQKYKPLEIIVVDDGSKDNTLNLVRRYGSQVNYIYQENKGAASARNTGIRASRGELIAFLDGDDRWLPDKLEKQYEAIISDKNIGLIHSDVYYWDAALNRISLRNVGRDKFVGNCYSMLFFQNRILTSSVLLWRKCIDLVQYFDETLSVAEDWDLFIRLARHYHFSYISDPLIYYRIHSGNISSNFLIMRKYELLVIEKLLRSNTQLIDTIGASVIRDKLYKLNFDLGYDYLDAGDMEISRQYFVKALRQHPTKAQAIILSLATRLSPKWLHILRGKYGLFKAVAARFMSSFPRPDRARLKRGSYQ
jgi:glycosyltransferase involved in cell wall biosynthesis